MGGLGRAGARRVDTVPLLGHAAARAIRVGTVATVALTACLALLALLDGVRGLDATARRHAALDPLERVYGSLDPGSPNAIRDPAAIERAAAAIPPTAPYAVVVGPRWEPLRTPKWTTSLERDFLRYHLLPRREVERVTDARWIFCLGCDRAAFPDTRVRVRSTDGIVLLERR